MPIRFAHPGIDLPGRQKPRSYRKPFRCALPEYAQAGFLVPVPKRSGPNYYLVGSDKMIAVDAATRAGQLAC